MFYSDTLERTHRVQTSTRAPFQKFQIPDLSQNATTSFFDQAPSIHTKISEIFVNHTWSSHKHRQTTKHNQKHNLLEELITQITLTT